TMYSNVRADGSTYQVVDYDKTTGGVAYYSTSDGYSVNSTWARGQAWGVYGFTMAYRYTQNLDFLNTAQRLAKYFIDNLQPDYVPVWDFSRPATDPRDSSAAAIAASGLLELSSYMVDPTAKSKYYDAALTLQTLLSDPTLYLGARLATDGIILHGSYNVPQNLDVNTSLIWGDYYFIQGCYRAKPFPAQVTNLTATAFSSGQVALSW